MKRTTIAAAIAAVLALSGPAGATLTSSEGEQIRGYVAAADHADRVRALVARPDLSPDESAAAMTAALATLPLDERHATFLATLVSGAPTAATRPVLVRAIVVGLLARVDALYAAVPARKEAEPS